MHHNAIILKINHKRFKMKKLTILILLICSINSIAQDYSVIHYEETTKKEFYSIAVNGSVYITLDSIAMYLYEPLMLKVVLYDITQKGSVYTGYLRGKKVTVKISDNVITVYFKNLTSKLYVI